MVTFITVIAIVFAVIVFLNLLSTSDSLKGKKKDSYDPDNPPRLDPSKVLKQKSEPGKPRPRICPICGSLLAQTDFLFAALEPEPNSGRKRQAHIYGCRHCVHNDGVSSNRSVKEVPEIDL